MARKPRQQATNNDAELARQFFMGCGIMFLVFLVGWAVIALFWLN